MPDRKIQLANNSSIMSDTYEKRIEELNWAIGLNRLSLRLIGVWPDDDDIYGIRRFTVILRVPFMILTMFFGFFLPQMYALTLVIYDFRFVIDNIMTSSAAFTSCVKMYFIWRGKQVLRPVVKSMSSDWLRADKRPWEHAAMRREAARARLFTICGYALFACCYTGFAVSPFFGFNVRLVSNITDYGERYLLVQSYFPYDYSKSPNFELTQAMQLIAAVFIGMSLSIGDNYFGILVFHASAQFEILGMDLEHCIKEEDASLRKDSYGEFNKRLGVFIDRHVHLMQMVTAVENSFNYVIVTQIFCMSVMVCCLGFQILSMFGNSGFEKPSFLQVGTLLATLCTLMMHTLIDCFASETLALRSAGIFYNIFNSKWYAMPQHSTKNVIPMMAISKFPRQLTGGKIFTLSLETFCSILKSIAGYISMLVAVSSR